MNKIKIWLIKMAVKIFAGGKMIEKFRLLLGGYKTYIAAIGLLIAAITEFINDGDVGKLITRIFEALAVAGIRAALK